MVSSSLDNSTPRYLNSPNTELLTKQHRLTYHHQTYHAFSLGGNDIECGFLCTFLMVKMVNNGRNGEYIKGLQLNC